ncbi:TPA: hypothetical protein SA904_001871, partial [Campylobacter jejuni]|nr:hypothetical protein [Campylobacter jejuni]
LKAIKDLQSLEDGEIKAIKKFGTKKDFKNKEENHFTAEPKEFEKNIIELDLTRLNRELIYEIHEIARNAHNPNEKNNKKLVLKVISAGSCLLYHTDFIISDSIVEEISNKYA